MKSTLESLPPGSVRADVPSPVGTLSILASDQGLHAILWERDRRDPDCAAALRRIARSEAHPVVAATRRQLAEYFAGKRARFDLPLRPAGTPFQLRAWRELQRIPFGKTISYEEQAARLGDRKKARAVGTANSRNPISIVVPCHRVVAKSGALSGFGGGVENKRWLLNLEGALERGGPRPTSPFHDRSVT